MVDPDRLADLQSRVAAALRDLPGATALYLYGSAADPARRDAYSDLDLQVLTLDFQASKDHLLATLEKAGAVALAYLLTDTAHELAYSIAFAGESPYHKVDLGITCLNDPAHPPTFFEQIRSKELLWSQSPAPIGLASPVGECGTIAAYPHPRPLSLDSPAGARSARRGEQEGKTPISAAKTVEIGTFALFPPSPFQGEGPGVRVEVNPILLSAGQPYCPAKDSPAYFLVGEIISALRYTKARRRGRHLVCWRFLSAKVNALLALAWWQDSGGDKIPERLSTWDLAELDERLPQSVRLEMLQSIDCRQPAQMDHALLEITRRMVALLRPSLGGPDQRAIVLAEEGLEFIAQELN
jgi:hypothetical protein